MMQNEIVTAQTVDLTNCDREPIHIPGSIQPHRILLVFTEALLEIVQVSNNTWNLLGIAPQDLLGEKLNELLDSSQVNSLKQCLIGEFEDVNYLKIVFKLPSETLIFDGIIHRFNEMLVLDLEPTKSEEKANYFNFCYLVKGSISKIKKTKSLGELCQLIVKDVRKITGFDRVMVYQFAPEGSGTVIAEEKPEHFTPYLGLHYPASDIPKQAKQLYTLNLLRLIPNTNYQPVELIPADNPVTNKPLDLSNSVLRNVSPIHIEYLNNMGIAASMSILLMKNQELWGLMARNS